MTNRMADSSGPNLNDLALAQVVAKLVQSPKYRDICEATLGRIARWAVQRHPEARDAEKAAKRKLHQIYGAYVTPNLLKKAGALVEALPPDADYGQVEACCEAILRLHASTRERLDYVAELYAAVWRLTGRPKSVLDLACGLNPLALPWMGLPEDVSYTCIDIDHRLIALIDRLFQLAVRQERRTGFQPVFAARCDDILVSPPTDTPDVALLMKTLPCLEQQEAGASLRLLGELRARHVVVSFPTRSLGGRQCGMERNYGELIDELASNLGWQSEKLSYPNEAVYVLTTAAG